MPQHRGAIAGREDVRMRDRLQRFVHRHEARRVERDADPPQPRGRRCAGRPHDRVGLDPLAVREVERTGLDAARGPRDTWTAARGEDAAKDGVDSRRMRRQQPVGIGDEPARDCARLAREPELHREEGLDAGGAAADHREPREPARARPRAQRIPRAQERLRRLRARSRARRRRAHRRSPPSSRCRAKRYRTRPTARARASPRVDRDRRRLRRVSSLRAPAKRATRSRSMCAASWR